MTNVRSYLNMSVIMSSLHIFGPLPSILCVVSEIWSHVYNPLYWHLWSRNSTRKCFESLWAIAVCALFFCSLDTVPGNMLCCRAFRIRTRLDFGWCLANNFKAKSAFYQQIIVNIRNTWLGDWWHSNFWSVIVIFRQTSLITAWPLQSAGVQSAHLQILWFITNNKVL